MIAKTKLAQTLSSGKPAVTAECLPPRGADAAAADRLAACFPQTIDAVIVPDNPDEVRSSALATAIRLAAAKIEPVLSLATRDRNRISLESEVLGAAMMGIRGFLCLSGDHQWLGVGPQAAGANDIDSIQLQQALAAMCRQGIAFDGGKLPSAPDLFVGAVAHPYLRPMELNIIRLKKKVAAGAQFLLTQAVFDFGGFSEWMSAVRSAGIDRNTAIIASVLPLTSVERARGLAAKRTYGPVGEDVIARLEKAADPAREALAICVEMASRLKAVEGIRGIHILSGGCESSVAGIIEEAHLA